MEIELVPDPGPDDPAASAALTALARGLESGSGADASWRLVPHSEAWRASAVRDAVGRNQGLGAAAESPSRSARYARPVRSTFGATRA